MSQPSSAPKFDIPLSSLRSLQNAIRFQYNYRRTQNFFPPLRPPSISDNLSECAICQSVLWLSCFFWLYRPLRLWGVHRVPFLFLKTIPWCLTMWLLASIEIYLHTRTANIDLECKVVEQLDSLLLQGQEITLCKLANSLNAIEDWPMILLSKLEF